MISSESSIGSRREVSSQRIMLCAYGAAHRFGCALPAAMVGVIGYTEEELISSFEDDMDYVVSQIERGDTAIGLPHADVYGDAPGLKPPCRPSSRTVRSGLLKLPEAPAVFVWRRAWQGGSLMIVRDQEGFEEKEQEFFILMLAVLLVVFLIEAAAGKRLAVQVMRPVENSLLPFVRHRHKILGSRFPKS